MFLTEDLKFRRLQHMDRYDVLLRKNFNRKLDSGIGSNNFVTDQPTENSRTKTYPTLIPSEDETYQPGRPSPHDLQYLAHSDHNGTHVYNPRTSKIESFPQHKFSGMFTADDLSDDIKNKIPPLRREEVRERHIDMLKNNSPKDQDLTEDQREAVRNYTAGSKSVNRLYVIPGAREYISPGADHTDRHLHELFDNHAKPLHRDLSVYTGTGDWNPVKDLKPGDTTSTKAWTSSSLNVPSAANFAGGHMIHFKLPKGYNKGMYIAPHSSQGVSEREYLMSPDQKWRYSGSRKLSSKVENAADLYGEDNAHIHTFEPVEE